MNRFSLAFGALLVVIGAGLLYLTFASGLDFAGAYFEPVSLGAWAVLAGAATVCEFVDTALGMGYGTALTPILMIVGFEPLQIVPAVLVSELLTGLIGAGMHHRAGNVLFTRKSADTRVAAALAACSIVGVTTAVAIAVQIPKLYLKVWIGVLVLGIGVFILWTPKAVARFSWRKIVGLGLIAAFNKGTSGGGYGPVVAGGQIVAGVEPKSAVGITLLAEGLTCLMGLACYLVLQSGGLYWPLATALPAGALLAVPFATSTVKRMPVAALRRTIGYVTLFLGTLTLAKLIVG